MNPVFYIYTKFFIVPLTKRQIITKKESCVLETEFDMTLLHFQL